MPVFDQNRVWEIIDRLGLFAQAAEWFMSGKEAPEGANEKLKGLSGLAGTLDEREMEGLYQKVDLNNPGRSLKFQKFLAWCVKHNGTIRQRGQGFIIRNRVTTYFTQLDNPSSPSETGDVRTRARWDGTDDAGNTVKYDRTTTEKTFSGGGGSRGLTLLNETIDEIEKEGENAKGYRKVLTWLRDYRKVPIRKVGDPGLLNWVDDNWSYVQSLPGKLQKAAGISGRFTHRQLRTLDEHLKGVVHRRDARRTAPLSPSRKAVRFLTAPIRGFYYVFSLQWLYR